MTKSARIDVRRTSLDSVVGKDLIAALDGELTALYPEPGATHFALTPEEVAPGRGAFVVAWVDGEPVGCGAVRRLAGGDAELKRMFVVARQRGRGISRAILAALEHEAAELSAERVVLETGVRQLAALALYESSGYRVIPAFGEYLASPGTSVCMAKDLRDR